MTGYASHHWHALAQDKVLGLLETAPKGLTSDEAQARLDQHGFNEVVVNQRYTTLRIFIDQFKSPLIYILLIAGIISFALGDHIDGFIILGAVVLNTVIGFFQELKVSNILQELHKVVSYQALVLRDGTERIIDAKELTVGDIVILRQGDKVPADGRLIEAVQFRTNEAALSGESAPVEKKSGGVHPIEAQIADRTNMVFVGTSVEQGVAHAVIVATGGDTEFGRIAAVVQGKHDATPLQRKLGKLAGSLGFLFLGLSIVLFAAGLIRGIDALTMFLTAVAVAVAAVPESLPIALSATLAVGAKRIFAKGGLIRKMIGAEALGSTTVICADKTATMTEGKMQLTHLVAASGDELEAQALVDVLNKDDNSTELITMRLLSLTHNATVDNATEPSEQWNIQGRPIDRAIFRMTHQAGLAQTEFDASAQRIAEIPFDSRNKYSAVLNHFSESNDVITDGKQKGLVTVLGAPEVILAMSTKSYHEGKAQSLLKQQRTDIHAKIDELAARGFKVLALGYRKVAASVDALDQDMLEQVTFMSLIAFSDPIRDEVRDAIRTAQAAGVRVVMITGDHRLTAQYVASEVGILKKSDKAGTARVIEGKDFPIDLTSTVNDYDVFARVSPSDKLNLVAMLKAQGQSVAMIGDGINDTPALVKADLGVSVGSGTDVAKEAADLVLMNDSFAIIVQAIRQGRVILDNIKKALLFLLSASFSEIILIAGSILMGLPLALLPAQILWVNIIEDGLPTIALAFEKEDDNVMLRKPEQQQNVLTRGIKLTIGFFAGITDVILFLLFFILLRQTNDIEYARTMIFVGIGLATLLYVFSVKSLHKPIWKTKLFDNTMLLVGVGVGLILYLFAIYTEPLQKILQTVPLSLSDWLLLLLLGVIKIIFIELAKKYFINGTTFQNTAT